MNNNEQNPQDNSWKLWVGILVITLLIVLLFKSCGNDIPSTDTPIQQELTLCTNAQISSAEASMVSSWENINKTSNLSSIKELGCLEVLEAFFGQDQKLNDISDIVYLTNLKRLHLYNTTITDVSPISQLTNLESLVLNNIDILDINPLQTSIISLKRINLANTNVDNIDLLVKAKNLESLNLNSTSVTDLTSLYNLSNLKNLLLIDTAFSKSWHKSNPNEKLDNQLKELQTRHPDLTIQLSQLNVINSEGTPFEDWKFHLNYLDLLSFL